jgi:hypothetical protein
VVARVGAETARAAMMVVEMVVMREEGTVAAKAEVKGVARVEARVEAAAAETGAARAVARAAATAVATT